MGVDQGTIVTFRFSDEIRAFLSTHRRAFLVTCTRQNRPIAHPMSLILDDDTIYFYTYRKSAKVRNLQRNPHVSCLVATSDDAADFAAVEVRGTAEVLDVDQLPESLLNHHASGLTEVSPEEQIRDARRRLASGKRAYVRIAADFARTCERLSAPLRTSDDGVITPWPEPARRSARGQDLAMSADEAMTYLSKKSVAALATVGPDGTPEVLAARYVARGGSLLLAVPATDPAIDNLAVCHHACATVEEFPTYDTIKGVILQGQAHAAIDDEWGGDVVASIAEGFNAMSMQIEAVVSFDFRKMKRS
jgi:nitroimidazol reductase NimA-like FMN-containing flavoprotein (pyridoxamine 5'-phosphate oxidase superfamily)